MYAADIGSVPKGHFGWAVRRAGASRTKLGTGGKDAIVVFADAIATDLNAGAKVAVGFEAPMWVPVPGPDDHASLGTQRAVDQGRPWSASAGATVLATGLAQVTWILTRIRKRTPAATPTFFRWEDCGRHPGPALFLWEAMVTGAAKSAVEGDRAHHADAAKAVTAFLRRARQGSMLTMPRDAGSTPLNLLGVALLHSGWATRRAVLQEPVVVVSA